MAVCLIVDDVTVTRFAARSFCEELNIGVLEAEDGDEALDILDREDVDVILLDWHLKKKSGIELLQTIREKHGDALKVILFSGVEEGDKTEQAQEAGANAFISKPTTLDKVRSKFQAIGVV